MSRIVLFLSLFLIATKSTSQQILWDGSKNVIDIAENLSSLRDNENNLTIQKVSSTDSTFILVHQKVLHFGFSESVYWLKFSLNNKTNDNLWLELAHAFIPYAELFFKDSSGKWRSYKAGYKVNLKDKIVKDHHQVFPLLPGENIYYIKLIPYMHPIPVRIWNSKNFQVNSNRHKMVYGIYTGILLFAIIVNFFLFFALKKIYCILYCFLVFFYMATSSSVMEGYVVYFFPSMDLMQCYQNIPVLDMLALIIYCIFFLEIGRYNSKYKAFLYIVCIYFVLQLFLIHFLPLMLVVVLNYFYALAVFILAIFSGFMVWRKGNRIGIFFVFAYAIWFLLVLIDEIYIQFGRPSHLFELSYVSIAVFIEALLLAFLQAKRFQWDKQNDEQIKINLTHNIFQIEQKFKEELLNTKLEIQEQTLKTISQEIHDNIGQVLSLAKLNLNTMDITKQEELKMKITDSKNLVSKAIQDLRDLSRSLNTDNIAAMGLLKAIEYELDMIRKTGFETVLEVTGIAAKMEPQKELIVFRIIQETLNNIIKHSAAKKIIIAAAYSTDKLELQVQDDGKGVDLSPLNEGTSSNFGLGIRNMHSRATMIGADFTMSSNLGSGTTVKLIIPFTHQSI